MRRLGRGRRAPEAELLQLLEVEATQEHRPGAATVLSLTNLCGHDLVGLSIYCDEIANGIGDQPATGTLA